MIANCERVSEWEGIVEKKKTRQQQQNTDSKNVRRRANFSQRLYPNKVLNKHTHSHTYAQKCLSLSQSSTWLNTSATQEPLNDEVNATVVFHPLHDIHTHSMLRVRERERLDRGIHKVYSRMVCSWCMQQYWCECVFVKHIFVSSSSVVILVKFCVSFIASKTVPMPH